MSRLEQVLTIIGATPYVKNGRGALSIQLIAESDAGKSRLILGHQPPQSRVINDFTMASLQALLNEPKRPTFLIVPDLNQAISHKPAVANLTMSFLLPLLGEGVTEIPGVQTGTSFLRQAIAKAKGRGITVAMITGLTPQMFFSGRAKWRNTGLLRRLTPIYYTYSDETQRAIQAAIRKGDDKLGYVHNTIRLKSKKHTTIAIPKPLSVKIEKLSEHVTEDQLVWRRAGREPVQAVEFAFSVHKTLRTYAMASALVHESPVVRVRDFDATEDFAAFVRYDRPERL